MKVVLLAPTPPPAGGIAAWTVRMINASLKNGWKVEVVDEKVIEGREVFGNKTKKNLLSEIKRTINIWKNLLRSLKDIETKVVHASIPATTTGMLREYICALITKFKKRKFIIHYRSTLPNMIKSKIGLIIFKLLTNISDRVIVLNTPSFNFVKKHSKTPVKIIPNFIEKSALLPVNKKKINDTIQKALYVGGVIKSKGCYDIIKVAKKFPEIQFRFVGNPDKEILNMDIPENCLLLGEKNKIEVQEELQNADIFLFLSYFQGEGFSNALAEAMAAGLPCIVTDWAANKDMIEGKGGIVVPVKDVHSIEEALKLLNKNKKLRQEQSNWNIKKVMNFYLESIITSEYVDLYEETIN